MVTTARSIQSAAPSQPRDEARSSETRSCLEAAAQACSTIAPTWPLDRFIAVNPLWARTDKPLPRVAGELAVLRGARLLMPRAWYAEEWRAGRLRREDLRAVIERRGSARTEDELLALFGTEEEPPTPRSCVVDVMDARPRRKIEMSWRDFVVHRTSQFCAAYFDDGQAQLGPSKQGGLFASWRRQADSDHGPALLMGHAGYRTAVASLPRTADEMIAVALSELEVPAAESQRYLEALLLDVNGWASWCAYLRWTARLAARDDHHIVELLAIRVAWECIVMRLGGEELRVAWRHAMNSWPALDHAALTARADDWLLQEAVELAWQRDACRALTSGVAGTRPATPAVQVVCCIDVRSEVLRRALEAVSPDVETLGFAGFFGLPIAYASLGADEARPQLPGLLAPRYRVTETGAVDLTTTRRSRLLAADGWKGFRSTPLSSFAFVEALGVFFAGKLLGAAFGGRAHRAKRPVRAGLSRSEDAACAPRITSRIDGTPISHEERCQLAEGMLRAMSLTRGFARLVVLVGHGSSTTNNPHAAGLDCGACCGQTGEVNARAAAALLNDPDVRAGLASRGIEVPASTRFLAALHDTTTDDVTMFDDAAVPASHERDLGDLRRVLVQAGARARRTRAAKLGLPEATDAALHAAMLERARSWAEVRPEWGLAGNAAFIVAPRERTRHLDLAGRAFLHEYRFEEDPESAILELIMTAPMVVAHWINLQYYASTVDNTLYGSGNKVLHNVVGGHLGVFEGNGGDLRIGLPLQSLHDGERWIHAPLRLSVFIEAPRAAIERVIAKHPKVRELVDNEWLYLFQLDATEGAVRARRNGMWT